MDQSDMAKQQKPSTSKAASKAKTKETLKRLKKKKNRGRRVSESSHQELMRKVNQRWGGNKQKNELKEALFDTETKRVLHPASYQRMMDRAVEAHMNRMLQPAPPADLLPSNWVCALCFQPSVGEKQGELFGPYFIRLSPKCQPPELLVPRKLLAEEIMEKSRTEEFSQEETDAQPSTSKALPKRRPAKGKYSKYLPMLDGSLDIWLHGECALWTPELFLVGGRLPSLQLQIQRYWNQECVHCHGIGATIPISNSSQSDVMPSTSTLYNSSKGVYWQLQVRVNASRKAAMMRKRKTRPIRDQSLHQSNLRNQVNGFCTTPVRWTLVGGLDSLIP